MGEAQFLWRVAPVDYNMWFDRSLCPETHTPNLALCCPFLKDVCAERTPTIVLLPVLVRLPRKARPCGAKPPNRGRVLDEGQEFRNGVG
jgi:hypothetical protein